MTYAVWKQWSCHMCNGGLEGNGFESVEEAEAHIKRDEISGSDCEPLFIVKLVKLVK